MSVLVTGGTGFIGSHTCVSLINSGYSVIVIDNLTNSKKDIVSKIKQITNKEVTFYQGDISDESLLENIFRKHKITSVIHFAGDKSVNESVNDPLKYYRNNVLGSIKLIMKCVEFSVKKFVFSSSATVYGNNISPLKETMNLLPATSPYGETKIMVEKILKDVSNINSSMKIIILRYFNPIGNHESGLIGESPNITPNNLFPYLLDVASSKLKVLKVYGDDYNTRDGTGVRDYIHVMDLAEGHVAALASKNEGKLEIYNLGTGNGYSVIELIKTFETTNNIKVPYIITDRRPGDLAISYADTTKANKKLGWKAKRTLEDMCRDAWLYKGQ